MLTYDAGYYSVLPYAIAQGTVELPYILVQAVIYSAIVYVSHSMPLYPCILLLALVLLLFLDPLPEAYTLLLLTCIVLCDFIQSMVGFEWTAGKCVSTRKEIFQID